MSLTPLNADRLRAPTERLDWIDLFRALAVVLMIETHVVNTFLAPAWRSGPIFDRLNFLNGLVAPAFLFVAGYLQGLGMRRNRGKAPARKWARLGALAAFGYALHFPLGALLAGKAVDAMRIGSQVDVLQCLAVSLALLLAIQRWAGKAASWMIALFLAIMVGVAPYLQQVHSGPVPLVAFINGSTGSLFPLFPWAGFVLAGALASRFSEDARELALPLVGILVSQMVPPETPFSALSLSFFLERLAWILILAWAVKWLTGWLRPSWLLLVGRQSLCMYAVHLILIAWISGLGMANATLGQTMLILTGVFSATWLVASLKVNGPQLWRNLMPSTPALADNA